MAIHMTSTRGARSDYVKFGMLSPQISFDELRGGQPLQYGWVTAADSWAFAVVG